MMRMRAVGWLHRRSDLRQPHSIRKIRSRKAHFLCVAVLVMTEVWPLMDTLPQDAFSPRRRGMDRRPLAEGFDVSISFTSSLPELLNAALKDVFDPARRYGSGDDDHFEADDVSAVYRFDFSQRSHVSLMQDGGFGPFSDSAATSDADPFTFSTSFSRELDDSTFDTFGDFGEFQAASGGDGDQGRGSRGGSDLSDSGAFGDLGDSTGSGGFGEIGGVGSGEMMSSWIVQDSWTIATASGSFAEEDTEASNRERQRRETGTGGS